MKTMSNDDEHCSPLSIHFIFMQSNHVIDYHS